MECIKSVQRAALAALPPDGAPYLAAGTVTGAVDADFSSAATVELFGLDFRSDATDLPLLASAPAPDRFYRLRWSRPLAPGPGAFDLGVLAGGLGGGAVALWNPRAMLSSDREVAEGAMVARLEKHQGPVRGLDFSELQPHMLASGADEGEVIVWDLRNPAEPAVCRQLKSTGSIAQSEISCISWNPQHRHILASTSYNGITSVWDVDNKRPVINLSDSKRRRCSVLQWNPGMPNQLIIAAEEDNSPLSLWDLRKAIAPIREFVGHTQGVIDMSWCPYDTSFLISCSKDNKTICWDTFSGEIVTEVPSNSNGNFDLHWYRKIPGVVAASSYDGTLGIYNLEFSRSYAVVGGAESGPAHTRPTSPKWLKCPVGASFGFGGKFVSFNPTVSSQGGVASKSEVLLHSVVTEHSLLSRSTEFAAAIQDEQMISLCALCDKKSRESLSEEESETWAYLKIMLADEDAARTNLLAHLGFNATEQTTRNSTNELSKTLSDTLNIDDGLFTGNRDAQSFADNGDDFFNSPRSSQKSLLEEQELNSTSTEQTLQETVTRFVASGPSFDASIQHALVTGDYKRAVNKCILANRMADALVIAHAGGSNLWESTCNNYIRNSTSPYLKVIHAVASKDLMSLVGTWPLSSWKEILALLCTSAQGEEWTVFCNTLASRLLSVGDRLGATLCYICAGNIEKTVEIWSHNLKSDDGTKTYINLLQDLVEKTITLALATGHRRFSASVCKLVENYAELLAGQGLLKTAMQYLDLLGSDEHSNELSILKDRIALSTEDNGTASYIIFAPDSSHCNSSCVSNRSSHSAPEGPHDLYQQLSQESVAYTEVYQHPPDFAHRRYNTALLYQVPSNKMFVPPNTESVYQISSEPSSAPHQQVKAFSPASLPSLKHVEQYQQPNANNSGSLLHFGAVSPPYTSGPPPPCQAQSSSQYMLGQSTQYQPSVLPVQYQNGPPVTSNGTSASAPLPGTVLNQKFPHDVSATSTYKFMPSSNQGFVQRQGVPLKPSNTTHSQPHSAMAPHAPPPTMHTVDSSNVSAELRPVVATLTRLFDETSRANHSKKREIEDNSRKIGALFAKLNEGEISPNVSSKLIQLCSALDNSDFVAAQQLQVVLTTSDWDECNFWLAALKRMIKVKQNLKTYSKPDFCSFSRGGKN